MYKIGDKVETPYGIGIVKDFGVSGFSFHWCKIAFSEYDVISLNEDKVKPYRTAHEKLIEMGFVATLELDKYLIYRMDGLELLFNIPAKTYVYDVDINLELSRILTQYLEELEE